MKSPALTPEVEDRFWRKVSKIHGCWIWGGAKGSSRGYGRFKIKGKLYSPHVLVYDWLVGDRVEPEWVLHKCDNGACVNPEHLFKGDRKINMQDCVGKGRHAWQIYPSPIVGDKSPNHKITEIEIKEIWEMKFAGMTESQIAKEFSVHQTTISKIFIGETWWQFSQKYLKEVGKL